MMFYVILYLYTIRLNLQQLVVENQELKSMFDTEHYEFISLHFCCLYSFFYDLSAVNLMTFFQSVVLLFVRKFNFEVVYLIQDIVQLLGKSSVARFLVTYCISHLKILILLERVSYFSCFWRALSTLITVKSHIQAGTKKTMVDL